MKSKKSAGRGRKFSMMYHDASQGSSLADQSKMKFITTAAQAAVDPEDLRRLLIESGDTAKEANLAIAEYKRLRSRQAGSG
jgi:hypothetical protein